MSELAGLSYRHLHASPFTKCSFHSRTYIIKRSIKDINNFINKMCFYKKFCRKGDTFK